MKITIQTPGFKANDKLTDFVQHHAGKLGQLSDRIIECRVCLKLDTSDTHENKTCEIKLVIPGNDLFASRQSETFEEAVTGAVDAIKHQLSRWKTVLQNQRTGL